MLFATFQEQLMGMNVGSGSSSAEPEVMIEMNMTPLIDVMLVLLIMLIITIPIQHHAIKLNMPVNAPVTKINTPPVVIELEVDATGKVLWNKEILPDQHALESKFKAVAASQDQPEIHLRPDRQVHYKWVAALMASAQRLGVSKVGLVGNERFDN
jgi:biopolymer transport protein ExbD